MTQIHPCSHSTTSVLSEAGGKRCFPCPFLYLLNRSQAALKCSEMDGGTYGLESGGQGQTKTVPTSSFIKIQRET